MSPKIASGMAALGTMLALAASCGSDAPKKPESAPTAATTQSSTVPADHSVIQFADKSGEGGVVLERAADASKLDGVPDDFRTFIVAELLKQQASADPSMADCHPKDRYIIRVIDTAGYAAGSVAFAECSGAQIYWAKVDDQWRKVLEGQFYPACNDFKKYKFPTLVAGEKCSEGTEVVTYAP